MSKERKPSSLHNTQFSVFGLGNSTYGCNLIESANGINASTGNRYQAVGRAIDQRMEELGANRVCERGEGDDAKSLEDDFEKWRESFWPSLEKNFDTTLHPSDSEVPTESNEPKILFTQEKLTDPVFYKIRHDSSLVVDMNHPYAAKVTVNKELHSSKSDRSCRHIELDISGMNNGRVKSNCQRSRKLFIQHWRLLRHLSQK